MCITVGVTREESPKGSLSCVYRDRRKNCAYIFSRFKTVSASKTDSCLNQCVNRDSTLSPPTVLMYYMTENSNRHQKQGLTVVM